jgi:hypothetical protein
MLPYGTSCAGNGEGAPFRDKILYAYHIIRKDEKQALAKVVQDIRNSELIMVNGRDEVDARER